MKKKRQVTAKKKDFSLPTCALQRKHEITWNVKIFSSLNRMISSFISQSQVALHLKNENCLIELVFEISYMYISTSQSKSVSVFDLI